MTDKSFEGQTIIITGAGAGMGKEHALLLGSLGASVVASDISDQVEEVVEQIRAGGGNAIAVKTDVSDFDQNGQLVAAAIDAFGHLEGVVINAGIISNHPFEDLTISEMDRIMSVNFFGGFYLLKHAWPHLLANDYGRVVVVSSASAWYSLKYSAHYAASKGALLGLAKTLAAEGAERGVTVNILSPGAFTDMGKSAPMQDPTVRKTSQALQPASAVSPAVAWLLRRENTLNGEIIETAAGRVARNFVGSTSGYWQAGLSLADIEQHEDQIMNMDRFSAPSTIPEWVAWKKENLH